MSKVEAQERVLIKLAEGMTSTGAMATVNRNDTTFRQWVMNSSEFKERSEKARLEGKGIKADLKELKDIEFPDFCEQFLDTKLFPHHLNWFDMIEGREYFIKKFFLLKKIIHHPE